MQRESFATHWREIAAHFLKLGLTAYGGPAIMGIMQAEIQERRGWVSKERFLGVPREDGASCAARSLCGRDPDGDGDRAARLAHRRDQADGERGGAGPAEEPRPDGSRCPRRSP